MEMIDNDINSKQESDIYKKLWVVPKSVEPPLEAYRYVPPEEESMNLNKNSRQRIIFHGGNLITLFKADKFYLGI